MGDPIELQGITNVFTRDRKRRPILVGSVKTNVGHGEAASGISSIIKTTLALEKGVIPASVGVKNINPSFKVDEWNIDILRNNSPWPHTPGKVRRASINSFGYGGANAHAILDDARAYLPQAPHIDGSAAPPALMTASSYILPFSASSEKALDHRLFDLASLNLSVEKLDDLAYTLGCRRSKLPKRGFVLARPDTLSGDLKNGSLRKLKPGSKPVRLPFAFVFTGQGAQWPEMGKELMEVYPSYRSSIQVLDSHLASLSDAPAWTLEGQMSLLFPANRLLTLLSDAILDPAPVSKINSASRSQPVCTAIQIALVDLLRDWDIVPEATVGHSSGRLLSLGRLATHDL